MAIYDKHLLDGEHLGYLVGKIKTLVATKIDNPSQKTDKQILAYDATSNSWLAVDAPNSAVWGSITGTITEQTDLQTALSEKAVKADVDKQVTDINSEITNVKTTVSNKEDKSNLKAGAYKEVVTTVTEGSEALITSGAVQSAIKGLTGFHFEIVSALPTTGETNVIYLVLKETSETGNVYTEYAYINNAWEKLGDTAITLEYLTNGEIDTIWTNN